MNIKEYIESGILDAYALGALTESERAEVEANIAVHPELAAELAAIEDAMCKLADSQAAQPPFFMMESIWVDLDKGDFKDEANTPIPPPVPVAPKTIPLTPQAGKQANWQRAAVWAAVLVSAFTNIVLLSQRNKSREEQTVLTARVDSMAATQQQLASVITTFKKERDMIANPAMQTVVMRKQGEDKMAGMVYWDKAKGETYLAFHNMPMPPQGKQYQLWVIQNGAPVSMGVITNDMIAADGVMKKIDMLVTSGQAFAISIEKEGGNPTPTEVYLVGAITS